MKYWLMKCEPSVQSIDDIAALPGKRVGWFGIRNYQARNYMRDDMREGDLALYYHSSCPEPGIAGIVRIVGKPYADPTQFDPHSEYFDPKASSELPRWFQIDVELVRKTRFIHLQDLRKNPDLASLRLLQKGNRLSITPVTESEWNQISILLS